MNVDNVVGLMVAAMLVVHYLAAPTGFEPVSPP